MVYYWKGRAGSQALLETYKADIDLLLSGDYIDADLEKFKHASRHIIYSYRLSGADRLLFTTHKKQLHVLEFIPNHDYQKSRFLKSGVLRQYLSKLDEPQAELFTALSEEDVKPDFSGEPSRMTPSQGFDYYNQQFIHLSTAQAEVVERVSLPLVLNGAAGSGKTYISFAMFQEKLEAVSDRPIRCLFLSKEASLVSSMRLNWETYFSPDRDETQGTVEFKTYHELLTKFAPDQELVSQEFFNQWFLSLKDNRTNRLIPLSSAQEFYQEFRICSGLSQEAYCDLGERQSSIPRGEGRTALYTCYLSYLRVLDSRIDPAFSCWQEEQRELYDFIVVDEAHRCSSKQNLLLAGLAKNHAIVYCLDANQNLEDQYSTRSILELQLRDQRVRTITLDKTYRCTRQVADALDGVLDNNRRILGGKIDKAEALSMSPSAEASIGEFYMMRPADVPEQAWLLERAKGVHLAVVTHPAYLEEARRVFKSKKLVFTVEEIQGQEFHTVVPYKLLLDDASKRILKKSRSKLNPEAESSTMHRSKEKTGHPDAPWAHRVFTACSRAMHSLVVVDEPNIYWDRLISKTSGSSVAPVVVEASSREDWEAMAVQQASLGNDVIAAQIREEELGTQAQPQPKVELAAVANTLAKSKKKKTPPKSISTKIASPPKIIFDKKLGADLFKAIKKGKKLKVIAPLIDNPKTNLNQCDQDGLSVLYRAILSGDLKVVQKLIATGRRIDLNQAADQYATTALIAAANEGNDKVVHELIAAGDRIDLEQMNKGHFTALRVAAQTGHDKVVRELVAAGDRIDLNKAGDHGMTALISATESGHLGVVRELLAVNDDKIDLNQVEKLGFSAFIMAAHHGFDKIVREFIATDEHRIDLNQANNEGFTALITAAFNGADKVVSELLKAGSRINLNKRNNEGFSALMLAAQNGHINVVRALVATKNRIDLNQTDPQGFTALMTARIKGHPDVVDVLLEAQKQVTLSAALGFFASINNTSESDTSGRHSLSP
ncbi:MAG: ankyrin repeat domain-containing protein [Legionellaceae bacterium]|nr:ankyrin repeat domain-containing protein [Legionellaceae bacterium]